MNLYKIISAHNLNSVHPFSADSVLAAEQANSQLNTEIGRIAIKMVEHTKIVAKDKAPSIQSLLSGVGNDILRASVTNEFKFIRNNQDRLIKNRKEIPDSFTCPISFEIMKDPVILSCDGYTYDKASIEKWFASQGRGPYSSPITKIEIKDIKNLTPNRSLKNLIDEYLDEECKCIVEAKREFDSAKSSIQTDNTFESDTLSNSFEIEINTLEKMFKDKVDSLTKSCVSLLDDSLDTARFNKELKEYTANILLAVVSEISPESFSLLRWIVWGAIHLATKNHSDFNIEHLNQIIHDSVYDADYYDNCLIRRHNQTETSNADVVDHMVANVLEFMEFANAVSHPSEAAAEDLSNEGVNNNEDADLAMAISRSLQPTIDSNARGAAAEDLPSDGVNNDEDAAVALAIRRSLEPNLDNSASQRAERGSFASIDQRVMHHPLSNQVVKNHNLLDFMDVYKNHPQVPNILISKGFSSDITSIEKGDMVAILRGDQQGLYSKNSRVKFWFIGTVIQNREQTGLKVTYVNETRSYSPYIIQELKNRGSLLLLKNSYLKEIAESGYDSDSSTDAVFNGYSGSTRGSKITSKLKPRYDYFDEIVRAGFKRVPNFSAIKLGSILAIKSEGTTRRSGYDIGQFIGFELHGSGNLGPVIKLDGKYLIMGSNHTHLRPHNNRLDNILVHNGKHMEYYQERINIENQADARNSVPLKYLENHGDDYKPCYSIDPKLLKKGMKLCIQFRGYWYEAIVKSKRELIINNKCFFIPDAFLTQKKEAGELKLGRVTDIALLMQPDLGFYLEDGSEPYSIRNGIFSAGETYSVRGFLRANFTRPDRFHVTTTQREALLKPSVENLEDLIRNRRVYIR